MHPKLKRLSLLLGIVFQFLIEKRTKHVDLVCKFWVCSTYFVQPQPGWSYDWYRDKLTTDGVRDPLETKFYESVVKVLSFFQPVKVGLCDVDGSGTRGWIH